MSVGTHHHRVNKATPAKLNEFRNTPSFRRMWARPFKVDVTRQVPDTAGYNVLGTVYYLDKDFYRDVMSVDEKTGEPWIKIPGMTPKTIITAILIHERTEKCLLDADNDVNDYLGDSDEAGAHEYATLAEHEFVRQFTTPHAYEAGLRQIIQHNEHKPLVIPPKDLDCEPHVDEMDPADKRALAEMRKLGVEDASKVSKVSVQYSRSTGEDRCVRCASWMGQPTSELAPCKIVSGAVRTEWWCKNYQLANAETKPQESALADVQGQAPAAPQVAPQEEPLHPHIKALVDSARATQESVQQLAKHVAAQQAPTPGAIPSSPQHGEAPGAPEKPAAPVAPAESTELLKPKKKRKRRQVKMSRDEAGNLHAEVTYDDGSKKHVKARKGADGSIDADVTEE